MARIAAIVLAAGLSSRLRHGNKLLADVAGKPLIVRTLLAICPTGCNPVVVVTGHEADQVEKVIQHLPVTRVRNPDFASGMGGSIAVGVAALPEDVEAVLICLADMPLIHPALIERLCDAYAGGDAHSICVPVWNGRRGHPVLFGRGHFPVLGRLHGDHGARGLIEANSACLREVSSVDDTVLQDADTFEALELLRQRFG